VRRPDIDAKTRKRMIMIFPPSLSKIMQAESPGSIGARSPLSCELFGFAATARRMRVQVDGEYALIAHGPRG